MGVGADPRAFDMDDFELRDRGRKYEDFHLGQTFDHHWGRTIDRADNTTFCVATCNWNPLYLNKEFAIANGHPESPINPALVVCVVVGLSVEDLSETAGPFLGLHQCVFDRPVYPGDTLTASSTVLECRESESRPACGVVTWKTTCVNQRGETVVTFVRSNLVEKRTLALHRTSVPAIAEGRS
jgi:itaconyl-CoA hydratase